VPLEGPEGPRNQPFLHPNSLRRKQGNHDGISRNANPEIKEKANAIKECNAFAVLVGLALIVSGPLMNLLSH
jgi:hypothetical protein